MKTNNWNFLPILFPFEHSEVGIIRPSEIQQKWQGDVGINFYAI